MGKVFSMTKERILITGANGEIGRTLCTFLVTSGQNQVIALDRNPASEPFPQDVEFVQGDILDPNLITQLGKNYNFSSVFHLAAVLSTGGEKNPQQAHQVNVQGSINLLEMARSIAEEQNKSVKFIFPSTIAIYGLQDGLDIEEKHVNENEFLNPITMYGINKLYVENLGRYYERFYGMLTAQNDKTKIDFRSVRLPGVLSAHSTPSGGTSDYGPEMIHSAAKAVAYECFVPAQARLPFMTMPDAVKAIYSLWLSPKEKLTRNVYNVNAFSVSAAEIRKEVLKYFPSAEIGYNIQAKRYEIVKSWPRYIDDSSARKDWGWSPDFDLMRAFSEYLIPGISKRYGGQAVKHVA